MLIARSIEMRNIQLYNFYSFYETQENGRAYILTYNDYSVISDYEITMRELSSKHL